MTFEKWWEKADGEPGTEHSCRWWYDRGRADTEAQVARLRGFIEHLIQQCELGRHVGSNIGVIWLEKECRYALSDTAEESK